MRAEIRAINPQARVVETERCAVDLTQVLDRGAFDLDRILTVEPDFLTGDLSTAFIAERPHLLSARVSADRGTKLLRWLADVTVNKPKATTISPTPVTPIPSNTLPNESSPP